MWALCALGLTGCIITSSHVGPGVLGSSFQQPPRDPDPRRDPTKEQTTSLWVPEGEAAKPGTRSYEIQRGAATLAAALAGALPMLTWYGTFDENLIAGRRATVALPTRADHPPHDERLPTPTTHERFYPPAPDEPTRHDR
jgi:hypothetical protein